MHVLLFDPVRTAWHYGYIPRPGPIPVQGTLRPVSPALWFGIVLSLLREAGHALPRPPSPQGASVLLHWDQEGNASVFPLTKDADQRWTELGHVLHRVAQSLIEDPDAWETVAIDPKEGREPGQEP